MPAELLECRECGEEFEEGDGVSAAKDVKQSGLDAVEDGESVPVDELFDFEEAFCSMGCAVNAGEADAE